MVKKLYVCEKCNMSFEDFVKAIAHEEKPTISRKLKVPGVYKLKERDIVGIVLDEARRQHFDAEKQKHVRVYIINREYDYVDGVFSSNYIREIPVTNFQELSEEKFEEIKEVLAKSILRNESGLLVRGEILEK